MNRSTVDVPLPASGPMCFTCKTSPAGTPGTWYSLSAFCCHCQPDPDPAQPGIGPKFAAERQAELDRARAAAIGS